MGKKLSTNTDANGRYHSNWMNMIYPRLFLARNLLQEDGVIFISIDDREVDNLKKICNEIFGDINHIALIPVVMNLKGNQDAFGFAETHEYMLVYAKNKEKCKLNYFNIDEDEILSDWEQDEEGLFKIADNLRATGVNAPRSKRPNLWYPIFLKVEDQKIYVTDNDKPEDEKDITVFPINPEGDELSWYWGKETFNKKKNDLIIKKTINGWQFYRKQRPQIGDLPTKKPKSLFYKSDYSTSTATTRLKNLMEKKLFDSPKPIPFIMDLVQIGSENTTKDIILDFFAGSGTTAHAVLEHNRDDDGNRRFICVQLPEPLDKSSEAYKAGYKTIADISKERIRRVIKKIEEESKQQKLSEEIKLDLGFRVFKLDRSNFKKWNNQTQELQTSLSEHVEQIKSNANPEDVLYEILIKDGFELTTKINKVQVKGKDIYSIENNLLLICLDEKLDLDLFKEMKKLNPHLVIVLDKGFKDNDQLKTNAVQTLGKNSDEEYILRSI
jgi:adenine-specific DNA-methyltransferase